MKTNHQIRLHFIDVFEEGNERRFRSETLKQREVLKRRSNFVIHRFALYQESYHLNFYIPNFFKFYSSYKELIQTILNDFKDKSYLGCIRSNYKIFSVYDPQPEFRGVYAMITYTDYRYIDQRCIFFVFKTSHDSFYGEFDVVIKEDDLNFFTD